MLVAFSLFPIFPLFVGVGLGLFWVSGLCDLHMYGEYIPVILCPSIQSCMLAVNTLTHAVYGRMMSSAESTAKISSIDLQYKLSAAPSCADTSRSIPAYIPFPESPL